MRQFYLLFLSISFAFFGFLFRNNPSDSAAVNYEKKFLAKQKLNPPKKYRPLVLKPEKIEVNSSEKSSQIWVDNALFVPNITATKSVVVNGGGNPLPGSQLDYTISLSNTGTDATGVVFTDILNSNLTLVPGSVKASPIAVDDSYDCIGNVGINVPVGSGLLANDINPVVSSMTVTSVNTAGTQGTVSHNPDGSFTFVPNVGFSGTTTFTYDVSNTHFTRTGTVTITVSAPIWFVNIAGGSGGTGTISSPFQNWSDFATANVGGAGKPDNNHVIFIYSGSYSGAATLRSGQKVLGAGATVSLASFAGITVPTHSFPALPSTSGSRPILTSAASTITLPSTGAISLRGFDMENSATDIASGATFGTLTTSEMTLNGTGRALLLNTGTLAATFNSITSTNSATNGISLAAIAGTLTVTGGTTITNPTTEGILLISSTSVTSLNANFGNTNITGSGGSGILTTGTTSNTATLTFGDLDIAPDAGVGAMNVWAANTITCTSGTITTSNTGGSVPGIYLEGASSAAKANLNMVLDSYTTTGASGALHGLTLKNTSGSFTINGTGSTAGSGGSISGFRDRGANFENASNITLKNMNFTNANSLNDGTVSASDNSGANGAIHANTVTGLTLDNIAISGTTVHNGINLYKVTNFSLANSSLASCGNNAGTSPTLEGGIHAIDLAGTCTINNVNISSPTSRGLLITQLANATPLVFNISGLTVTDTYNSANGNDGVEINCNNSTVSTLNISGSTILRSKTNGVQGLANNNSALTVNIQTSTISNGGSLTGTDGNPGGAIELSSNNNASLKFNILNNVGIKANGIAAVYIGAKINGTAEGRINDNPNIRTVGTCCGAIWADVDNGTSPNNGNMKIEILRNTLSTPNSFDQGIYLRNANGAGRLDATINNNNISTSNSNSFAGIWASAGTGTGTETNITCANMNTNAITNIAAGTALFADEAGSGSTLQLQRNSGSGTTAATIWPANGNTPSSVASGGNNIIVAPLACLTPSNPLPSARIAFTEENARTSENTAVISEEKKETEIETEENVIEETEYISETKETLKVEEIALEKSVASPQAGETITVNGSGSGFNFPANKSVTITFSATVSSTPTTCAITNTASVNYTGAGSPVNSNTTTTNLIVPPPTGVTTATAICNGQSISLSANCSSGAVQWYNVAQTATLLGTGSPFTQSPTGNTTYQAACKVGGCESARTNSGLITVNPLPVPNPLSNSTVCSGNSLNLSSASSTSYSWTGPNSFTSSLRNPTISNVTTAATGTYSITQTNSFGCTASATTSVTVNQTPTASVGSNSPICSGNTLNLTSNGGGTYSWTGPNSFTSSLQNPNINSATTAATGTYIVTVTSNGCTATNSVVVTVNANPTASPSSNSPQCEGSTLNLSSTSASTYAWSGPNSFSSSIQNPTISNVTTAATGTYTLTVSNVSGCTASATTAITINAKPVPNPSSNSPLNVGGTLNLSSNGGGTYAWAGPNSFSSSSQNPSISNVTTAASGTYTVTVTTSGCSATATTAVVVNEAYASSNSPICSGATLNLSAGGGVSYSWSGPNSFTSSAQNPSFSNATSSLNGVYTVLVTASGGGTATATTLVTVNALPVPNPSSDSPKCVGSTLTFGSAAGMTSYSWSGPNSFSSSVQAPTISNISTAANGTYTLTVINANGCSASATTAVIINTLPTPTIGSNTPICSGQTLNLTSSGGNSYAWAGPNSFSSSLQNPTINNTTTVASGTYTLTASNVEGCSATVTTVVTINSLPPANPTSNSPLCMGNTLNLSSSSTVSYLWTGPNSFSSTLQNPSISGATVTVAGIYTLTVTNAQSCSATATTSVEIYNPAVLTTFGGSVCPPGGVVNLSATGNGTIQWYDSTTGQNLLATGNTYSPNISTSTTYMVQDVITTGITTTAQMPNQTSTFSINARGYYFIAPTDFTMTSLFVPTTASSGNQSIAVVRFKDNVPPPLYSSTTNDFTTLFLTQNNTEVGKINVNIQVNAGDVIGILGVRNNVSSYSNTSNTTTIGNYQVPLSRLGMQFPLASTAPQQLWTENATNISRTEFDYVLVCRSPKTPVLATVNPVTAPTIIPPSSLTVCSPNTLTLTATGCSGTVTWSEGGATGTSLTLITVGTYTVSATCTENGCTSVASTPVTGLSINPLPLPNLSSNSPVCVGNTLNLSSSSSTSYLWAGPNSFSSTEQNPSIANVTTAANGTYTITQTNSFGCTASATTAVTINALPVPSPTSDSPKCVGTTLSLSSAAGMSSYAWSGPNSFSSSIQNPSISNVTTAANGVYTLTVSNASGCSATATTSVIINTLPVPNPTSNSPICAGETVSLSSAAGMSAYNWSGPNSFSSSIQNPTISNATTAAGGTYTILVTDANGCSASSSVNFIVNPVPETNLTSNSPVCVGGTISLSSAVSFRNSWSGPNGFKSNLDNPSISNVTTAEGGVYTVTKENLFGCTATATINVVVNSTPTPTVGSNSPVCSGLTLNLTANGGTVYAWNGPNSFSSTQQNPTISNVSNTANGTYTVTVTNVSGCSASATTSVVVNPIPTPVIGNNSPICESSTLNLTSNSATTYSWSGPNSFTSTSQNPSVSGVGVLANGIYSVVHTNSFGCSASATTQVTVNPNPVVGATASMSAICVGNSVSLSANCTSYSVIANLTGGQQVPAITTNGTGTSIGTYNSITNQLTLATSFANLGTSATMAHIHSGATGVNGGVLVMFSGVPSATSGNFGYTGNVSSFASDLLAGNTYINIHTTANSGGEIRGQLSAVCTSNNYVWSPGNLSGQTITVSPNTTTVYTVTASNSSTGCSATATTSVNVNALPIPSVGSNSPLCSGLTLNLTSTGGSTYAWTGPNSFASTAQNPSILNATTSNSGVYSVTITNINGCTATATTSVTVFTLPNPNIGSNSPLCESATLSLNAENGGTSYVWSGPNSFNSTLQNPTIGTTTLANAGVYSITITNSSGCTATATTVVVINPLNVSATNTGPYTTNQTIQLVGSGGNIYSWTGPNGFTATGAIVNRANATTNMAGVYTATITNGPCSNTATTNVVVTGIDPCVQLLEYTYVQAGNPYQPLFSLSNGMNIAQSPNPTSVIVHPICSTVTIESVEMNLQGPDGMNWNILQNVEPFALFDNAGLNVFGRTLVPGNYTLTVTGYSQDNKGGVVTYPKTEVRFTITGNLATVGMPTYSGTEFCAGSTVPVSFTTTGTFNSGNIFKVQLSDGNGDFTTPIEIGSSTTAGSINCLIPLSIPFGENYRMRVVSTDATSQNMNPSAIVVHPYIANLITPTDDLSVDKTRKAVYQLNATNKVNSPAKVNYRAGNSIQLNAGFEAKAGTVFEAKIAGCN